MDPMIIAALISAIGGVMSSKESSKNTGSVKSGSSLTANQSSIADAMLPYLLGKLGGNNRDATSDSLLSSILNKVNTPYDPSATNEYFNTNVYNPAMKTFNEDTLPSISESYVGPGTYWGSERAGAEAKAKTDIASSLAQQLNALQYQAKTDKQNQDLQYYGLASSLAQNLSQSDIPYLNAALTYLGIPMMYNYLVQPQSNSTGSALMAGAGQMLGTMFGKQSA